MNICTSTRSDMKLASSTKAGMTTSTQCTGWHEHLLSSPAFCSKEFSLINLGHVAFRCPFSKQLKHGPGSCCLDCPTTAAAWGLSYRSQCSLYIPWLPGLTISLVSSQSLTLCRLNNSRFFSLPSLFVSYLLWLEHPACIPQLFPSQIQSSLRP